MSHAEISDLVSWDRVMSGKNKNSALWNIRPLESKSNCLPLDFYWKTGVKRREKNEEMHTQRFLCHTVASIDERAMQSRRGAFISLFSQSSKDGSVGWFSLVRTEISKQLALDALQYASSINGVKIITCPKTTDSPTSASLISKF